MNKYLTKAVHYFAGNLFNKVLLIAFLPIFTHFLLPEEYAVYTNFLIFIAFANLIYLMGMQQALFSYFHVEFSNDYKYSLISSVYVIILVLGLMLSIIILLNGNSISQLITRDIEYVFLIPFIILTFSQG